MPPDSNRYTPSDSFNLGAVVVTVLESRAAFRGGSIAVLGDKTEVDEILKKIIASNTLLINKKFSINKIKINFKDEIIEICREFSVRLVILCTRAQSEISEEILVCLGQLPLAIKIPPEGIGAGMIASICAQDRRVGLRLIPVIVPPLPRWGTVWKFMLDRGGALVAIIIFLPLLIFCASGILLLSRGPIFFLQERVGLGGEIFYIIKFRTMHPHNRKIVEATKRQDARVFPFGKILRKLSLDELPQLLNVLRGDMSLVGPRPHMVGEKVAGIEFDRADERYHYRYRMKPGITGLAQINGARGPVETLSDLRRRVSYDLFYIKHWSPGLDLLVLWQTFWGGFTGKNAV